VDAHDYAIGIGWAIPAPDIPKHAAVFALGSAETVTAHKVELGIKLVAVKFRT
jgi:hypothetical protein